MFGSGFLVMQKINLHHRIDNDNLKTNTDKNGSFWIHLGSSKMNHP